jgi:hypothetical protein
MRFLKLMNLQFSVTPSVGPVPKCLEEILYFSDFVSLVMFDLYDLPG